MPQLFSTALKELELSVEMPWSCSIAEKGGATQEYAKTDGWKGRKGGRKGPSYALYSKELMKDKIWYTMKEWKLREAIAEVRRLHEEIQHHVPPKEEIEPC